MLLRNKSLIHSSIPDGGFQLPDSVDIDRLLISTGQLVNEQKIALNIVIAKIYENVLLEIHYVHQRRIKF